MSTQITPELAAKLRQGFKTLNKFMLWMWRLGLGSWFNLWPEGFGQIMVMTHTGRVTGYKHRTPVNFAILEGNVYCIAGFGKVADWYRNIVADPQVEIWLPEGWWKGIAEDVSDASNRLEIMRAVVIASGFAGPLFGIDPKALDDAALDRATQSYKVMRIQRVEACTGPGGPGDLAWFWQVATLVLLLLVTFKRRRK